MFSGIICAFCACAPRPSETPLVPGTNPVYSPDGSRIAFQRLEGGVFKIGVIELPERGRLARGYGDGALAVATTPPAVEWIEAGPGNAAYPAWTPDGALIYTYGHDAETAYAAWKSGSANGYGLRIREPDGTKRDLTHGRCRDYAPCVSPDGRAVWFVTTRGVESESASFSKAAATRLAALDLDTGKVKFLLDAPNGSNSGYTQPAISPDGQFLIWAQLDSFFDTWRIYGARLNSPAAPQLDKCGPAGNAPAAPQLDKCGPPGNALAAPQLDKCGPAGRTSPASLTALSPRWHPNGRMICFTGFHAGDDGWGVWVADLPSGKVRRLCTGENPCFSPDGGFIAYDRDGMIFVRSFDKGDIPDETLPDTREEDAPEHVAWGYEACERQDQVTTNSVPEVSGIANDSRFAFGDDTTVFIRATARPGDGVRQYLAAAYAEHPRALQLYASGGQMWFVSFDHAGKFFAAKAPIPSGGDVRVIAVRTPTRLLLSLNGGVPSIVHTGGAIPLDTPQSLTVGDGVISLEIGTGWPHELPKPQTLEKFFF